METYECIRTRRSIRKYLEKPIPRDLIVQVLDAGRLAPSAGNLQNWKFILVIDEEKKEKIAEACIKQLWVAQAPLCIVIVAEPKASERYYGTRGDRLYSVQNCAAAVQNMLLMAHNIGLGACWVGAFDEGMVARALKVPEEVRVQAVVTLGYPAEKVTEPAKFPLENVTYFNKWRGKVEDEAAYLLDYALIWERNYKKGKAVLEKHAEKITEKAKEATKKIKKTIEEKQKKQKAFKEFKKVYNLK